MENMNNLNLGLSLPLPYMPWYNNVASYIFFFLVLIFTFVVYMFFTILYTTVQLVWMGVLY